jgi:hypothetical protein
MTAAYVMTYDNLVTDIAQYLERTDAATLAKIPTFIGLTEQKIATQLKILGNLTVQASTFIQGANIIDKPARWHKTVSFNITVAGRRRPVLLRTYEYLREYWPDPTQEDVPKFFADYDYTHWMIAPTPDAAYNFEILYYERIQPLDSSNQTNWFTIYAPQALLYGSLVEASMFLKNYDKAGAYGQQFETIMQTMVVENKLRIADRQAVVMDS